MPNVELNGTSIYYESYGEGLPVVFIHDYRTSHRLFEPQIEYFRHRLQVIVWDLRGNGLSGKMNVGIDSILDAQCEDLKSLLDCLGVGKAILVACSSGGVLARKFASKYLERTRALVLIDSSASAKAGSRKSERWISALQVCAQSMHYLPAELFLRPLRITYGRWLPAYAILRREVLNKRTTEAIKQSLAVEYFRPSDGTETLRLPTLLVGGAQDQWTLRKIRRAASECPSAHLEILEDAIYPSHLCQPHRFNRLLLDFLNDHHLLYEPDPNTV